MATREEVLHRFIHNRESMIVNREVKMSATLDKIIENAEKKIIENAEKRIELHSQAVKDGIKLGLPENLASVMGYGNRNNRRTGD